MEKQEQKKKSPFSTIYNIIVILLFLFVSIETIIGILDINKLKNNEKPVWYIDSKVEKKDNKKITTYNIGLYKVNKVEEGQETKISLKLFFLK